MRNIHDINEIHQSIKSVRDLKKGFLTNFFPDPAKTGLWMDNGLLFTAQFQETTFFFRKETGFYHLYFCSSSANSLCNALTSLLQQSQDTLYTIDLIGNRADMAELGDGIVSTGFFPYTSLVRMSRMISVSDAPPIAGNLNLAEARPDDAGEVLDLLQQYFDPLAENLPLMAEIESWIKAGQVAVFRETDTIQGFLIYEILGVTSYLRYWFVHPDHREKKIGSILIQEFFRRCSRTKRQLFWVIQSNENAIKRYIHYGFLPENLVDNIYTNTNIQYGGNNN
jgi:GNAT superfamily N-acetyltransferase